MLLNPVVVNWWELMVDGIPDIYWKFLFVSTKHVEIMICFKHPFQNNDI